MLSAVDDGGQPVVALAVLGGVVLLIILPLLVGYVIFSDSVDPKPRGYRVRLVVGFAVAAGGVLIIFLHVSAEAFGNRVACGSALQAMFSWQGNEDYQCGSAGFPYLFVAGGVAAVGMGVAFWGEGRGRLLAVVCIPLLVAVDRPCRVRPQRRRRRSPRPRRLRLARVRRPACRTGSPKLAGVAGRATIPARIRSYGDRWRRQHQRCAGGTY
jgi:hypothetical protein